MRTGSSTTNTTKRLFKVRTGGSAVAPTQSSDPVIQSVRPQAVDAEAETLHRKRLAHEALRKQVDAANQLDGSANLGRYILILVFISGLVYVGSRETFQTLIIDTFR